MNDTFNFKKSNSMQHRIWTEYIFVPSIEIYRNRKEVQSDQLLSPVILDFVDALALAIFKDGKWQSIEDGDLLELIDNGEKFPLLFCSSAHSISAGIQYQENNIEDIYGCWLSEEIGYMDWKELTLQAALKLKNSHKPARICLMYSLVWHKSVDWETGIDEGNFEIAEVYDSF